MALRLGEDNARFLLLFFVMLIYILAGAALFSLLERDNEIASVASWESIVFVLMTMAKMMMIRCEQDNEIEQRKTYHSAVQQFLDSNPSVNRSDLNRLLQLHNTAATAGFVDEVRTRWDFSGSFSFVSTVVSTIGEPRVQQLRRVDGVMLEFL